MAIENIDCFFSMARQHAVCQDYALGGMLPAPFAVLCDGCSSSKHSDVGARLLAISARKFLAAYYNSSAKERGQGENLLSPPSYREAGLTIIGTARVAAELLDLNASCLDATLLLAFPHEEAVQVYVYGDGCVAAADRHGAVSYTRISFRENMPYYLSYWDDEKRQALYLEQNRQGEDALRVDRFSVAKQKNELLPHDAVLSFRFPQKDYRVLALLSDGVAAMSSIAENRLIPEREVLGQLLAYKTTRGNFAQRRARRMMKSYHKQDVFPTDDLSVAAILLQ